MIVDGFTRWQEAIPLRDACVEAVTASLLTTWLLHYGLLDEFVTDWGAQSESSPFAELCCLPGTRRVQTTTYHPSTIGLLEEFYHQLKNSFRALPSPAQWAHVLPLILLYLHAKLKWGLGCSAADLAFGTTLRLSLRTLSLSESPRLTHLSMLCCSVTLSRPWNHELISKSFHHPSSFVVVTSQLLPRGCNIGGQTNMQNLFWVSWEY